MSNTTETKLTKDQIDEELCHYHGSERLTRPNPFRREFLCTEGVMRFAELAECHWFLDAVALGAYGNRGVVPDIVPGREEFAIVLFNVSNDKAKIEVFRDLPGESLFCQDIEFTDCVDGEWKFFISSNGTHATMMLPSEY